MTTSQSLLPSEAQGDPRLQRLIAWSRETLNLDLQISVASADASFRRYFRARHDSKSWIVMDAPPEKEDTGPYIKVAEMLVAAGVNAPKVFAQNRKEGYLLLSDLGDRTYLAELADQSRSAELYRDALVALVDMQAGCRARAAELPPYDAALLRREVDLFPDWFVKTHLGIEFSTSERNTLEAAFQFLIDAALKQARVFVHRDYHSRNLMVSQQSSRGKNPGVLDFQDAVYGPMTYDLVSLLRDCYIDWPLARVHAWVRDYRELALRAQLPMDVSEPGLLRDFDLMGIQRHLKAIGIFSRLAHRDGKRGYLNDIPRTLNYVRSVLPSYPELASFGQLIESRVMPALAQR